MNYIKLLTLFMKYFSVIFVYFINWSTQLGSVSARSTINYNYFESITEDRTNFNIDSYGNRELPLKSGKDTNKNKKVQYSICNTILWPTFFNSSNFASIFYPNNGNNSITTYGINISNRILFNGTRKRVTFGIGLGLSYTSINNYYYNPYKDTVRSTIYRQGELDLIFHNSILLLKRSKFNLYLDQQFNPNFPPIRLYSNIKSLLVDGRVLNKSNEVDFLWNYLLGLSTSAVKKKKWIVKPSLGLIFYRKWAKDNDLYIGYRYLDYTKHAGLDFLYLYAALHIVHKL